MNNSELETKILDMTKDVVKDVYVDTVKPAAKNIGGFLETLSGFFSNVVVYPLKKLNDVTVTRRQNNALISKLQTHIEKEIAFLDIFRLVQTEYSKGTSSTWWVSISKDRTKLVFSFKNMKYK